MIKVTVESLGQPPAKARLERIEKARVTIGRSADNDIVLPDGSVSHRHAEILYQDGNFYITDLGSTNGTLVNNQSITPKQSIPVDGNNAVIVGVFRLKVSKDGGNGPTGHLSAPEAESESETIIERIPESTASEEKTASEKKTAPEEKSASKEKSAPEASAPKTVGSQKTHEYLNFKKEVHNRLLSIIDLRRIDLKKLSDEELRKQCLDIVQKIVKEKKKGLPSNLDESAFIKDVLDEALGLGPLEDLLEDPRVSEVMVNRKDQIYVEKDGKIELSRSEE